MCARTDTQVVYSAVKGGGRGGSVKARPGVQLAMGFSGDFNAALRKFVKLILNRPRPGPPTFKQEPHVDERENECRCTV